MPNATDASLYKNDPKKPFQPMFNSDFTTLNCNNA